MIHNTSPEFVGIEGMKSKLKWQLDQFEGWASRDQWDRFHDSHYDWWMFPIDASSRGQGLAYTVYDGDIAELKQDETYIRNYLRGAQLVAASWGWDLDAHDYLTCPRPDQHWHQWPVRLFKEAQSLQLFGYHQQFDSLKKYALLLMQQGEPMTYAGHDLSWLFTTGIDPRESR
jgi:hypothetical protein